jgi:hypothetical protein
MKRFSIFIIALGLALSTSNAQGVLVVSHIESTDFTAFGNTLDQYMSAVKKATETENLGLRVHRVDGSRELIATRWFDSMKDMVDKMDEEESKNEEIGEILQSMPEPVEGNWNKFVSSTDFKGSSVWEFVPEASTVPKSWESMSQEERDELRYRRVQYFSVDTMQDEAFEAWWAKANESDAKLGITNYHLAMFKSVFGGNDADYMIILLDKSRFDYYNHFEDRAKKRNESEEFGSVMSGLDNSKWSVIGESNWIRLPKMTH